MIIRFANTDDAAEIAWVHVLTWQTAYRGQIPDMVLAHLSVSQRTEFWQNELVQMAGGVFVAEDAGKVIGFCTVGPSRDKDMDRNNVAEIAAVYVLPNHWRQGVGKQLMAAALAVAQRNQFGVISLWVLASNRSAQLFYQNLGFAPDGATKMAKLADGSEVAEMRMRRDLSVQ